MQAQSWERALESCKAATFKAWTRKQRKERLRREDSSPGRGRPSSPLLHPCSHRDAPVRARACVCVNTSVHVSVHMCVQQRDGTSSASMVAPELSEIFAKSPLTPSFHKVTDSVNFVYIANASLNNSPLSQNAPLD